MTLAIVVPLHGEHRYQLRQLALERAEAHQLPDPTIVTLCLPSWAPRVAMALERGLDCSLKGGEERREGERMARRRRVVAVIIAMFAGD